MASKMEIYKSDVMNPWQMAEGLGKAFLNSGIFGIKNEAQAFILGLECITNNTNPIDLNRKYHFLYDGSLALKTAYMYEIFLERGGAVDWLQFDSEAAKAEFAFPGKKGFTMAFTFEDAKDGGICFGKGGTTLKDNWKASRPDMLRARLLSKAIRMLDPVSANGLYTKEEHEDLETIHVKKTPETEAKPLFSAPKKEKTLPKDDFLEAEEIPKSEEKDPGIKETVEMPKRIPFSEENLPSIREITNMKKPELILAFEDFNLSSENLSVIRLKMKLKSHVISIEDDKLEEENSLSDSKKAKKLSEEEIEEERLIAGKALVLENAKRIAKEEEEKAEASALEAAKAEAIPPIIEAEEPFVPFEEAVLPEVKAPEVEFKKPTNQVELFEFLESYRDIVEGFLIKRGKLSPGAPFEEADGTFLNLVLRGDVLKFINSCKALAAIK